MIKSDAEIIEDIGGMEVDEFFTTNKVSTSGASEEKENAINRNHSVDRWVLQCTGVVTSANT